MPPDALPDLLAWWLARRLTPYLFAPPPTPAPVTLTQAEDSMRLRATPPPLDANVASIELHYVPTGGTETIISMTTEPVEFDVLTPGDLSYFTVAIGKNGVRSAPCPTAVFTVADTTAPATPGNVTLDQVG